MKSKLTLVTILLIAPLLLGAEQADASEGGEHTRRSKHDSTRISLIHLIES